MFSTTILILAKEVFIIGTPNFNFPTISENMTADVPRDINNLSIAVDTELAKKYTKPLSGIPTSDLSVATQSAISNNVKTTDKATQSEATAGTNDTKFMTPLRVNNVTGTLTSLQTTTKTSLVAAINETFTQVVNGKGLIATAINDRGGSASGSDTFQQLADKIEGLVPKYSAGSAAASSATITFTYRDSSTINRSYVTVGGLDFIPSRIVLINGGSIQWITEYNLNFGTTVNSIRMYLTDQAASSSALTRNIRLDGISAYVNNTGFRMPVDQSGNYLWYAYE